MSPPNSSAMEARRERSWAAMASSMILLLRKVRVESTTATAAMSTRNTSTRGQ